MLKLPQLDQNEPKTSRNAKTKSMQNLQDMGGLRINLKKLNFNKYDEYSTKNSAKTKSSTKGSTMSAK